jgi:hypothetical protein
LRSSLVSVVCTCSTVATPRSPDPALQSPPLPRSGVCPR